MDQEIEVLADGLMNGQISCSSCPGLTALVEDAKSGKISMEEFKGILQEAKNEQLQKVV